MRNLSADAQRLLEERPALWEYRFFAQIVEEELTGAERMARTSGEPALQASVVDETSELPSWAMARVEELATTLSRLPSVVDALGEEAFGPPGTAGEPEKIETMAREIAFIYRQVLAWEQDTRLTPVAEAFVDVREELAAIGAGAKHPITAFPGQIRKHLDTIGKSGAEPGSVSVITLEVELPDTAQLVKALADVLGVRLDETDTDVDAFEAFYQDEI